jgi:8-oxo-dGTP diphosphatase
MALHREHGRPRNPLSGDGFITLADGSRRWGRFGAAGILARHTGDDGVPHLFVARRSEYCHRGGTWAIPGGALDHGEAPLDGALREFAEETGVRLDGFEIGHVHEDDHGGWSYWTLVVDVAHRFPTPTSFNWETAEARWVPVHELTDLELFDAFEATLAHLGLLTR